MSLGLPCIQSIKSSREPIQIESPLGQRLGQDQRLLGVVRDFPRSQIEPTATDNSVTPAGNAGGDLLAFAKLHRPTQGIAAGQSQQCPGVPIGQFWCPSLMPIP